MKPLLILLILLALLTASCDLLQPEPTEGKLRVKVIDEEGNPVEDANIHIVWRDLIAPRKFDPPPVEVFVSTQITADHQVRVFWGCIVETGISGYEVYRSNFPDGSNLHSVGGSGLIEHIPGCVTYEVYDQNVTWGKVYYYFVRVLGPGGADWGLTDPAEAILADPGDVGIPTQWDISTVNAAFSGAQLLKYQIPEDGKCSIRVYNDFNSTSFDILDEITVAGYHQLIWDGRDDMGYDIPNGLYRVVLFSYDAQLNLLPQKTIYLLKNNTSLSNMPNAVSSATPLILPFDTFFRFDTPLAYYNQATQTQTYTNVPYFIYVHVSKPGYQPEYRSISVTSMKKEYLAQVILRP